MPDWLYMTGGVAGQTIEQLLYKTGLLRTYWYSS